MLDHTVYCRAVRKARTQSLFRWKYTQFIWKYTQFIWKYTQFIWKYTQFIWKYTRRLAHNPCSYENTHPLVTRIPYSYEYTFLIYINTHSVFVWLSVCCRALKKARTQPYSGKAGVPKLQVRHDKGALYARHDSSLHGTWLFSMWDMTPLCERRGSFLCETWCHMAGKLAFPSWRWDMAGVYVRHDSSLCETWLICVWGMTWLVCMWDMTPCHRHGCSECETWLYVIDMAALSVRHDSMS